MPLIGISIKLERIDESLLYQDKGGGTGSVASARSTKMPRAGWSSLSQSRRNALPPARRVQLSDHGARSAAVIMRRAGSLHSTYRNTKSRPRLIRSRLEIARFFQMKRRARNEYQRRARPPSILTPL